MSKEISFSDLPDIAKSHPFGLLTAVILLGVLLIYSGTIGCVIKTLFYAVINKTAPLCNSDSIFKVKLGEWIISLFNYDWFIYLLIIIGVILYFYTKSK